MLARQSGTSTRTVLLYPIWSEIERFVIGSYELTYDQGKVGANSFNVGVKVIPNMEADKKIGIFFVKIIQDGHK